ncbi:MAG: polymer-forming cytoskeletal protein [Flavobacteriales bacterium]|nr:polymer-forming cytoskeletal protein [Flavobacteriales bacterium]
MFAKKEKIANFGPSLVLNLVGEGTEIQGDINSAGDIRIDGLVKGNVSTKAKMVLGTTGRIEGEVNANSGDVSGYIKGNLIITDMLFLKSSGHIDGNITTSKMIVESGGEFNGNCHMHGQNTLPVE